MPQNLTLSKIIIGLIVILLALVLFTGYRLLRSAPDQEAVEDTNLTASSTSGFEGATPEEIEEILSSITPSNSDAPMTPEEIQIALEAIRKGEQGTTTEPAITPEGESKPLTEEEIKAELDAIMRGSTDNEPDITPE